ncbi:thiosulfate sulfurtransferase GlpE [Alteromonas sp. CYL-A6]|uniref:thiosulfate sulfurtransferase GlpE n=1 Tax=Alteromonas nitratireducens TaxID=3390813 RepID=UPI0034BB4D80
MTNTFSHISVTGVDDLDAPVIVDIRDPQSYANGHIPASLHLTNDNVAEFIDTTAKDKPVVVVCYHGNSSQHAAQVLVGQGFSEVYSMDGGFEAWRLQGKPVESAS